LAEAGTARSTAGKRRAYKNVFKDGEKLLEASPAAPKRWQVLGTMFNSRKSLFGMDNSDRNREALFETCTKLAEAPQMRKRAAVLGRADAPSPYKSTHERLKDWLKQHRMETQK